MAMFSRYPGCQYSLSRNIRGTASDRPHDDLTFRNVPTGAEKATVYFPRSCINKVLEDYNYSHTVQVNDQGIEVIVAERNDNVTRRVIYYQLDKALNVVWVNPDSLFESLHRQLSLAKQRVRLFWISRLAMHEGGIVG